MKFFYIIFTVCFFNISASQHKTSVKDSLIIKKHIDKLNIEEFTENGTQAEFDSLAKYTNDGFRKGNVNYSPDNKFKIFVIEGESCGHCCNPMFKGFIYYNLSKKIKFEAIEVFAIDKILKTNQTDYLIFSKGGQGCGIYSYSNLKVISVSIVNNKLVYRDFFYKDNYLKESNLSKGNFGIEERQLFDFGNEFKLNYNKKTKKINFQFTKIIDEVNLIGKFYKGEFILKNGNYYCSNLISKEIKIQ